MLKTAFTLGQVPLKFLDNNYRYRVDPPDKLSGYEHIHFFDKYGNALNSNYEVVSKKRKEAHIPIKESDNSLSNEEYKKSLR